MKRRMLAAAAAAAMAAPLLASADAQTIRDDFSGAEPSAKNWFICNRPENHFAIETAPSEPGRALLTLAEPRPGAPPPSQLAEATETDTACVHQECGPVYGPEDKFERAEIWEHCGVEQELGADVWYQFAMYIDPSIPPIDKRLVIGQWKQSTAVKGGSPVLAQRFNGRRFTLSVEQNNDGADRDINPSCRIFIAAEGLKAVATDIVDETGAPISVPPPSGSACPSVAHDFAAIARRAAPSAAAPPSCARDIACTRSTDLPDPFGHWVTMRYHLRDLGSDHALVEVWADDRKVVEATGRIGYRAKAGDHQYFKFGPYRDWGAYRQDVFAEIARYRRGGSAADVK